MQNLETTFKILIGVLAAFTLYLTLTSSTSPRYIWYNLAEWSLIFSAIYAIFHSYAHWPLTKKRMKQFGILVLILMLAAHVFKVVLLVELGNDTLHIGQFFKPFLFWPTLQEFAKAAAFGLLLCILLWFFKQPKRKMFRITILFTILTALLLFLASRYVNRDLSNQQIYFEYDINTLEEVQEFARDQQKTLYLDFWHSGCGPCLQEFSKHEEFRRWIDFDKVHFFFIGADRSIVGEKQKQRVLVEKYGLKGTHTFISREEFAKFLDEAGHDETVHGTKAFPHHMIIGRNGTVLRIKAGKPTKKTATELNAMP